MLEGCGLIGVDILSCDASNRFKSSSELHNNSDKPRNTTSLEKVGVEPKCSNRGGLTSVTTRTKFGSFGCQAIKDNIKDAAAGSDMRYQALTTPGLRKEVPSLYNVIYNARDKENEICDGENDKCESEVL